VRRPKNSVMAPLDFPGVEINNIEEAKENMNVFNKVKIIKKVVCRI